MNKLLFVGIFLLASSSANAEWTYMATYENKASDVYVDLSSFRKDKNLVKAWFLDNDKASKTSFMVRVEFDCINERYRLLSISDYAGLMGKGDVKYSHTYADNVWEEIPLNSMHRFKFNLACKK